MSQDVQSFNETLNALVREAQAAVEAIPAPLLPPGLVRCADESELQRMGVREWAQDIEILMTLRDLHGIPFTEFSANREPRGTVLEALVSEAPAHLSELRDGSTLSGEAFDGRQTFKLFCIVHQIAGTSLGLADEMPGSGTVHPTVKMTEKGRRLITRLLSQSGA